VNFIGLREGGRLQKVLKTIVARAVTNRGLSLRKRATIAALANHGWAGGSLLSGYPDLGLVQLQ
jgi:hypothetical protein